MMNWRIMQVSLSRFWTWKFIANHKDMRSDEEAMLKQASGTIKTGQHLRRSTNLQTKKTRASHSPSKHKSSPLPSDPSHHVNIHDLDGDLFLPGDFFRTNNRLSRSFFNSSVVSINCFRSRCLRVCSNRMVWSCSGIQRLMMM